MKYIRFATDLAVFYIGLPAAGRLIDRGLIAFAATRALESSFHVTILGRKPA